MAITKKHFSPDPDVVARALHELNGNVAAVAKQFNVSRGALQQWIAKRPDIVVELNEAREEMLDMAESSLYRRVLAGDSWAVCFFLKTQGRKRGYIERAETYSLNVNLEALTIEQLERLAAGEHPSLVLGNTGVHTTEAVVTSAAADRAGTAPDDPLTIEGTSRTRAEEETD